MFFFRVGYLMAIQHRLLVLNSLHGLRGGSWQTWVLFFSPKEAQPTSKFAVMWWTTLDVNLNPKREAMLGGRDTVPGGFSP